jgi:hypothetical protein
VSSSQGEKTIIGKLLIALRNYELSFPPAPVTLPTPTRPTGVRLRKLKFKRQIKRKPNSTKHENDHQAVG